jgi:hypothetical protein
MRVYQDLSHRHTYREMKIIRKDADAMYHVAIADPGESELKFCVDPDFDEGMTVTRMVYEDRGRCKEVFGDNLGFIVNRDEHGKFISFKGGSK